MTLTDQAAQSKTDSHRPLPRGFRYAGVACGIKKSGKPDVSLIVADRNVVAAGVYTQNQIVAAPVVLCRSRTPSSGIRAIITNSGNANACTGEKGMQDAEEMCRCAASKIGCEPSQVLVMSTGVIGRPLPMDRVRKGISDAHACLGDKPQSFIESAEAIRTTDRDRKIAFRTVNVGPSEYTIAAMAKGAGMIAPNMATMLAVILTDAPVIEQDAQRLLGNAAKKSFNRVSVDGHTSTNDTLLLLASSSGEAVAGEDLAELQRAIDEVCIELAKSMVADGEGATHVMAIRVSGAQGESEAEEIAKTVAASLLVKTAITGGDPNWGRIVSAAGYARATIQPQQVSLQICDTTIYENGTPVAYDEGALSEKMKSSEEVAIHLCVGDGPGQVDYWSSDLTTEYVRFNSEYTT